MPTRAGAGRAQAGGKPTKPDGRAGATAVTAEAGGGRRTAAKVREGKPAERLLEDLNPPQREAVVHGSGPLLVLAGAGSGKTRVLTRRVGYLVATGAAKPSEILAITFTNKAAAEMRERVEQLVGGLARLMWVMTFHSACARVLRAEATQLGYTKRFSIYDEADSVRLIRRCLDELSIDPKRFAPRAIKARISSAKNQLRDAEAYGEQVGSFFEQTVADVYGVYERRIHEMNALDFDDLLFRTVNVLELFPETLERYRRTFRWLLVDEYQDTNHAQYRLLQLLAGDERNVCVVGDDDQSIYSFRGAEIRNILDFERDFPGTTVVRLEQNYRSTQTILSTANAVVANNSGRKPKELWTELAEGDPVHVRELEDEHSEARYIAAEIEQLSDDGIPHDQVAVFYRTNAQSRVLEDTLVRFGVPYQVIGGTKFYERAEIKDALAYLALLVNPQDTVSFSRVVNSPKRGIGRTSEARILSHANSTGMSVWDVAVVPEDVPGLGPAAVKATDAFMSVMERLRELAEHTRVGDLLEAVLQETGYVDALEAERTIEAQGRLENLQELVGVGREFDATWEGEQGLGGLAEFIQQLSLYSEQDALRGDEDIVTLMTLHNAKGLEYPIVFMIGCEEGVFPHSRSIEEGNLEEERRLCYVGITRARRKLYVTFARTRSLFGARSYNMASRFIDEIPVELTDAERAPDATSWEESGVAQEAPIPFRVGDDVLHASFGEGVVIGVEQGGVVVVRFASNGAERRLTVDYAPLRRIQ
jgi:DNA helicase II / ATP-dependent DNA helicase PcrA